MPEKEEFKIAWERLAHGNERALSEIYSQHYLALTNYGRTIIDDIDLVSDCLLQMLLNLRDIGSSLKNVENVRSYLMTSLRRAIILKVESEKRHDLKRAVSIEANETSQWSYEEHLVKIQSDTNLSGKITKAMAKLTDRQKELVKLKFFDDLTYDEIAEQSAITKRTAYNIIHNAIKILKEELYNDQNSSFSSFFLFFI